MKKFVLLCCALLSVASTRADFSEGLIAAYFFDGNAEDSGGQGLDAQLIGATYTADRFGQPDGALLLDGHGAYASTPVSGKRFPIAFSFWLRLDARRGERAFSVIDSGIGDAFGHSFVIGNGVNTYNANMAVGARFVSGRWAHVVVSYGPKLQVFINGELAGEREYEEGDDYVAGNFQIGRHFDSPDARYFHGAVDDVLIFDRTLSLDEAKLLFENGPQIAQSIRERAQAQQDAAAALASREVPSESDSTADPRPIFVVASAGAEPNTNAWHVFDGNPDSEWTGAAGAPSSWIAAEFYPPLSLRSLAIDFAENSPTNSRVFYSETADEWPEFNNETPPAEPPSARFLLITFPANEEGLSPSIREIRWNTE